MIRLYAIAALLASCLGLLWHGQRLTHRAEAAEAALASATAAPTPAKPATGLLSWLWRLLTGKK